MRMAAASWIAALCLAGCAGTMQLDAGRIDTTRYRNVYVMDEGLSTVIGYHVAPVPGSVLMLDGDKSRQPAIGNTAAHIALAIRQRGMNVVVGPSVSVPPSADLVITFEDVWQWDLKMYLKNLTIQAWEHRTKRLVAAGKYEAGGGGWHDFPTSEREASKIIAAMFGP